MRQNLKEKRREIIESIQLAREKDAFIDHVIRKGEIIYREKVEEMLSIPMLSIFQSIIEYLE